MRVVVACDWFLKYASEQAAALADYGHEVVLVHRSRLAEFAGSQAEQDEYLDLARRAGVTIRTVRGGNRSLAAAASTLANALWLRRWRPQVVHLHPNTDHWLWLLFRVLGAHAAAPQILTVHDPTPHPGHPDWGRIRGWIERDWMRRADGFVLHGDELARLMPTESPRRPTWIVPHGVRISDEPLPVPSTPSLLLFGRLQPYKGISVLMQAMELIWAERDDVRLVVAGTGPSEGEVIAHPNIDAHLRYIAEEELPAFFAQASLVLAPYTEASQSGVLSQAIGQGIPVVVSDQGALAEMAIFDEAVVPAGDPDALAAAILALIDHTIETRREVLESARAAFSWASTAELVTPFYAALGSGTPAPVRARVPR